MNIKGHDITRREFLAEAAAVGMAAAAARAADGVKPMDPMPTIKLGKLKVSRLVLGSNPFFGFSHTQEMNRRMKAWYTDERIVTVMDQAAQAGITAVVSPPYPQWIILYAKYLQGGGKMRIWIAQPDPSPRDMTKAIAAAARGGAKAIFIQGARVDAQFAAGKFDVLTDWLKHIRGFGLPAGLASHRPDVHLQAERRKLPADFYFQCFYNPPRYGKAERDKAVAAIQRIDKPVVGYKICGAGRKDAKEGFAFAFRHIRAKDGVCVGVFPPRKADMIAEDAALARRLSAGAASRPAGKR